MSDPTPLQEAQERAHDLKAANEKLQGELDKARAASLPPSADWCVVHGRFELSCEAARYRNILEEAQTRIESRAREHACAGWQCVECATADVAGFIGESLAAGASSPIEAILFCPICKLQHVDEGEWTTKPHRTHLCASCGNEWRAAELPTMGVRSL